MVTLVIAIGHMGINRKVWCGSVREQRSSDYLIFHFDASTTDIDGVIPLRVPRYPPLGLVGVPLTHCLMSVSLLSHFWLTVSQLSHVCLPVSLLSQTCLTPLSPSLTSSAHPKSVFFGSPGLNIDPRPVHVYTHPPVVLSCIPWDPQKAC